MLALRRSSILLAALALIGCDKETVTGPSGDDFDPGGWNGPEVDLSAEYKGLVASSIDSAPIEGALVTLYGEEPDGTIFEIGSDVTSSEGLYHIKTRFSCPSIPERFLQAGCPGWNDSDRAAVGCQGIGPPYQVDFVLNPESPSAATGR